MGAANSFRLLESCRLCHSSNLEAHFDFGEVPLGNNLTTSYADALLVDRYPLSVKRCLRCGHFQLSVAVAPKKMYATNYTYLSGVGKSFVAHFHEYAVWIQHRCHFPSDALVVDIGSNDGTCLKAFKDLGLQVCGVDPASIPAKIANETGINTLNAFFDAFAVDQIVTAHGKADFVTSHNVLAHVDDLRSVLRNIYSLLKNGGYFCFEIGYFKEVLRAGCFDTIYHEHLDYHHAMPLTRYLCEIGFDLIDLSINQVQGGSLRLFLKKTGEGKISPEAQTFLNEEKTSILYQPEFLSGWLSLALSNMEKFGKAVKTYVAQGKMVVGYGVPTKATLLMKISKLSSSDVSFIVEDNELKVGRFTPGTGIPILSVDELKVKKPDIIVILAWNFYEDIVAKLKDQVHWPVKFLVPLPNFVEETW